MKALRHLVSILILPGTVTVLVPALLIYRAQGSPSLPGSALEWTAAAVGTAALLTGLVLMASSIALFMRVGKGTLAPWDPTVNLVVEGVYCHVRNPMISGVFGVLLGESLLLRSLHVFYWFIVFVIVNAVYTPLSEEKGLIKRFGDQYLEYKKNVPRWIPRVRAWNPPWADGSAAGKGEGN